jgi:hypothetical protein
MKRLGRRRKIGGGIQLLVFVMAMQQIFSPKKNEMSRNWIFNKWLLEKSVTF